MWVFLGHDNRSLLPLFSVSCLGNWLGSPSQSLHLVLKLPLHVLLAPLFTLPSFFPEVSGIKGIFPEKAVDKSPS